VVLAGRQQAGVVSRRCTGAEPVPAKSRQRDLVRHRPGISLSSSPGCGIEWNLIVGNGEGFNFREQTRTTPTIEDRVGRPVWNHDQLIGVGERSQLNRMNSVGTTYGRRPTRIKRDSLLKKPLVVLIASAFVATAVHAGLPVQTTFTGVKSERTWKLEELDAGLPVDWTGYDFLVLEFKASSSQRFDLGLETSKVRTARRIGPFAGVWVRAAILLRFYRQPAGDGIDMAAFVLAAFQHWRSRRKTLMMVPDQNIDPDFVVAPVGPSSSMPIFRPELQLIPRSQRYFKGNAPRR